MRITFDPFKRDNALADRGLDFLDAEIVFEGVTLEVEDTRKDYGEHRIICYAYWPGGWLSSGTHRVARTVTSSV